MKREYYKDINYKPFLYFVIFGISSDKLEVSKEKHKVDCLPDELDIRSFTRKEHGDYMDGFFSGPIADILSKRDKDLFEKCKKCDQCVIIQGNIIKDDTFDYMRNVIGIIQAYIEKGAIGVLDFQTFCLYSSENWTDRFFDKEINAQNHVAILCSKEQDGYWLHTRGMLEFGRPDIGIYGIDEDKMHDSIQIINQMIFYGGQGALFKGKVRLNTIDGKSFDVEIKFIDDFDNNDYNNAYYIVKILDFEQK